MTARILESSETLTVKLSNGDYWAILSIRLEELYAAGDLVRLASQDAVAIEGTDELSASYRQANWLSGVTSGALYAFRALKTERRVIQLVGLAGRLRAGDIQTLANGAAVAIGCLLHQPVPHLELQGWQILTAEGSHITDESHEVENIAANHGVVAEHAQRQFANNPIRCPKVLRGFPDGCRMVTLAR